MKIIIYSPVFGLEPLVVERFQSLEFRGCDFVIRTVDGKEIKKDTQMVAQIVIK